jgi:hypothetical protein
MTDLALPFRVILVMALVILAGFASFALRGLSSFAAPLLVHVHALVFVSWVGLTVVQAWAAAHDRMALHRRLGWLALAWLVVMPPLGVMTSTAMVAAGHTPPDFKPQHFLFDDPATLLAFWVLAVWAVARRRNTGWHWRLHICALASALGPAIGRMLPPEWVVPHSFGAASALGMMFPLALAARDWWRNGRLHPAWLPGLGVLPVALGLAWVLAESPLGHAAYAAVVRDGPAANVPGLAFGMPAQ